MDREANLLKGEQMPETYSKTCEKCGSLYSITKIKLIMRDIDQIDCDVCGAELLKWNGAVMYTAQLVKRADWPKKN